jgi:hypothetical protein
MPRHTTYPFVSIIEYLCVFLPFAIIVAIENVSNGLNIYIHFLVECRLSIATIPVQESEEIPFFGLMLKKIPMYILERHGERENRERIERGENRERIERE